jgi:Holliday junction resolvase RusA-like endonuclease
MSEKIHLSFIVPGRAVPFVRTTTRQQFRDPYYARYRDYKDYFSTIATQAISNHPSFYCDKGTPVELSIVSFIRGRRRIDADNLLKSFMDSMNSIIYHDDSQVVKATIEKVSVKKEENERVEVRVSRDVN